MPPENGGYMVAAYVVTAVILVGYAVLLVRRARRAIERVSRLEG
jgi:CcmD family protein